MLFKNAKFYTLTSPVDLSYIESRLSEFAFRPCGSMETSTVGWAAPIPGVKSTLLCHIVQGVHFFALKKEERILPARVINRELAEKVEAIEAETGSVVGKKAQVDIKQEIITRLLPQAFCDQSVIYGAVIPESRLVIVQASSDSAAELFLAMLRKSIGSLPVVPLVRSDIGYQLTSWVNCSKPVEVELLEEVELKSTDETAGLIKAKNTPLDSEEIQQHLDNAKLVQKLAIEYDEAFSCVFCADGSLKRIKFSDRMIEENADIPKDQVAARFDADAILCISMLVQFVGRMREELQLDEGLTEQGKAA